MNPEAPVTKQFIRSSNSLNFVGSLRRETKDGRLRGKNLVGSLCQKLSFPAACPQGRGGRDSISGPEMGLTLARQKKDLTLSGVRTPPSPSPCSLPRGEGNTNSPSSHTPAQQMEQRCR